jgi:hypothetical protein
MSILPTDIRILFTNFDIIAYFLNLASCSEHFISIKHRILATFNINKKKNSDSPYVFKEWKFAVLMYYSWSKWSYYTSYINLIGQWVQIRTRDHTGQKSYSVK